VPRKSEINLTVAVELNAELVSRAAAAGVDVAATADAALAKALEKRERDRLAQELREAVRLTDEYVVKHGHPFPEWLDAFSPEPGAEDAA